ncbi:MAG TPA: hypothetical protein VGK67_14135 [Myxococcales bacterium]|jgi:hypothetical protein
MSPAIALLSAVLAAAAPAPAAASASPEQIRKSFDDGRRFFVESHVKVALEAFEQGGYVAYRTKKKEKAQLGPDVFREDQLYDLVLFLASHQRLGYGKEDPLVQRGMDFLVKRFDPKTGTWPLWSAEGCLHTKGMALLHEFGHDDLAKPALSFDLNGPMNVKPGFCEGQSGFLIQSWGNPTVSLIKENLYTRERVTAEMTILNLLSFQEMGMTAADPVVKANLKWVEDWISTREYDNDEFDRFAGLIKIPELIDRYGLKKPKTLQVVVDVLEPRLARPRSRLERDVYFRGEVARALFYARKLDARVKPEALDAAIAKIVSEQAADGHWATDIMDMPKQPGLFLSNLNGTATFVAINALRSAIDELPPVAAPAPEAGQDAGAPEPADAGSSSKK